MCFSILLLIIGALNKSNVQVASKEIVVIKEYPKLKNVILQLMLDILLLPYKWNGSDQDSLAGFNTESLKRLRLNIPLLFTDADYHEQVIYAKFIFLFLFKIVSILYKL